MDFYNFCTVVSRKKYFIQTWQKCPFRLNNVLTLPSENENITFHTFIMHSLNITRCIKLNDRPDCIIHRIEVWWVLWPHVWRYGLSFSNVCMRPEFMTSMSCNNVCMSGVACSSRWLVNQWQTRLRVCVRASGGHFKHNLWLSICFLCTWWTLCLQFTPCLMQRVIGPIQRVHYKCVKCDVFIFTR